MEFSAPAASVSPAVDAVVWDMSRVCGLRCLYCRQPRPIQSEKRELTTEEGRDLIHQIQAMGIRRLILSVGHPAVRADWLDLAEEAHVKGMTVLVYATVEVPVSRAFWNRARRAGIQSIGVGLDSVTMRVHDGWHGRTGVHLQTIRTLYTLYDLGLPIEIHTVVTRDNLAELEGVLDIAEMFGAIGWHVHLLIPTASSTASALPNGHEIDDMLSRIILMSGQTEVPVTMWEAPQIRRTLQMAGVIDTTAVGLGSDVHVSRSHTLYISPTGEVWPHEAIPVVLGNVRQASLTSLTRNEWLRRFWDPDSLHGACGRCSLRRLCGGSRARAYAMTGDAWATDPGCPYASYP